MRCEQAEEGEVAEARLAVAGAEPEQPPSWSDYVLHAITLFWKILFAFVPPTGELFRRTRTFYGMGIKGNKYEYEKEIFTGPIFIYSQKIMTSKKIAYYIHIL